MFKASRLDHLDLLRGLAALLVLAGHLRAYIFQSAVDLEQAGLQLGVLGKVFYFATELGHQAVMVFFALSGYLVGGKALDDILEAKIFLVAVPSAPAHKAVDCHCSDTAADPATRRYGLGEKVINEPHGDCSATG
jgi:hypothetical protein